MLVFLISVFLTQFVVSPISNKVLTSLTWLIAKGKREWAHDSVKHGLRVSLNNSQVILAFSLRAQITQCIKYSKLWLNKPYYCHFESHIWRLWIWLGSIHNLSRGWAMMIPSFFSFHFFEAPPNNLTFFFLTPPQEMLIYQRKISKPPPPPSPST